MSNLRFIKQEISTSAVSSMSITDCFSSDFDVYQVVVSETDYGVSNTDIAALRINFINASGDVVTASNYDSANMMMKADATKDEDKFTNGAYSYSSVMIGNYESAGGMHWIMSPHNGDSFTYILGEGGGGYNSAGDDVRSSKLCGGLKQVASMTGIQFYSANASNTFQATITVYGLRVDL